MKSNSSDAIQCNFCSKDTTQVKKLLAGENHTHICSDCVELCYGIIKNETVKVSNTIQKKTKNVIPTPKGIHNHLNNLIHHKILNI